MLKPTVFQLEEHKVITLTHSPIASNRDVLGGTLVFAGTRVPVQTLLDYLDDGCTLNEFLENFPSVSRESAIAVLKLARDGRGNDMALQSY